MSEIQNVSDTALLVAAYRAQETKRADALFRDPLAARLAGPRGEKITASLPKKAFMSGWSVVIRTRLIDELIRGAIAGGVDTVVNLGAGLDTRPYRLELPANLRWVEADFAPLLDAKEQALREEKPHCRLERVRLDLADDAARARFLDEIAASSKQVLVLTEGVLPYLTPEAVGALAADLRARPSFRFWIVDYFSKEAYEFRRKKGMTKALENAPFRFEPADFDGFFRARGWRTKTMLYLAEEGQKLGRPVPLPWLMRAWLKVVARFAPPETFRRMSRFAGYALLEPIAK